MNRQFVKAASELLAFCLVVGIISFVAHPLITGLVVVNSIAGAAITDINRVHIHPTAEIQNNRISLAWGMRKIWRNNTWGRR